MYFFYFSLIIAGLKLDGILIPEHFQTISKLKKVYKINIAIYCLLFECNKTLKNLKNNHEIRHRNI